MHTVQTDAKGRLNLGKKYALNTFIIEEKDGEFLLRKAAIIPEKDLWLLKNPEALKEVEKGLKDAREGKLFKLDHSEYKE
ncbi:MAG: hypothetical protein SNF33_00315 (plasmid) [Candidatus Algichlamydia australiensis]|nr:hypothetical protein [Chlamydiales bacterium]